MIFATTCWASTFLGFYGIVVTLRKSLLDFLITSFSIFMVLGGIFFTRQVVDHTKGVFVSDREISLPGLFHRKGLIIQEIEKIIVQDSVFFMKGLITSSVFLLERETNSLRCELFISGEKIIDSIERFCPQVEVITVEESLEKKMKKA